MAVKFTKGQICNGTISKNICHKEYNLHGKFHTCFTRCTIFALCRSTNAAVLKNLTYYDCSTRVYHSSTSIIFCQTLSIMLAWF